MRWNWLFLLLSGYSALKTMLYAAPESTSREHISLLLLSAVASLQRCTKDNVLGASIDLHMKQKPLILVMRLYSPPIRVEIGSSDTTKS
ncbi:unnamed protein product [Rhodiola kirilowii]